MTVWLALIWLIVWTAVPGLELRASIPIGFFKSDVRSALGLPLVVTVCLLANIAVGMLTFWLMGPIERTLRRLAWFDRAIWPMISRAQAKLHPYVEKYGEWGVAIFIGVPLPGTGAYTGAFGSYLLGLDRRKFWIANAVGVLIACVAVTALCVLIDRGAVADDSLLRRIFLNMKTAT
ncbi:MAG: small multi-drug export protein [Kiritimatiellae bacterium]|nr:small multi-drug export protein [Kiritimatiellia bacterium]